MPVVLQTPYTPSVPTYDKVHMDHLTITLERTEYAKTRIQARVRPYYQDPVTGKKSFSPEHTEIAIDDAEQWIIGLAQQGDLRGVEAEVHIKSILALLVETCTSLGNANIQS